MRSQLQPQFQSFSLKVCSSLISSGRGRSICSQARKSKPAAATVGGICCFVLASGALPLPPARCSSAPLAAEVLPGGLPWGSDPTEEVKPSQPGSKLNSQQAGAVPLNHSASNPWEHFCRRWGLRQVSARGAVTSLVGMAACAH